MRIIFRVSPIILSLIAFVLLTQGCAFIEVRSLQKPHINLADYSAFTTFNQAQPDDAKHLRDEVLLDHTSKVLSQMGYSETERQIAQARVTLIFDEGFEKVFIPPYTEPIVSYTHGEFTTVTDTVNGETIHYFGYIHPRLIEEYVAIPGHEIDVYKLKLRLDIYDSRTLTMIWTGTAYTESSPGGAIKDARRMINKLLKQHLPSLK